MQIAEQLGSTFANVTHGEKHGSKDRAAVPVTIKSVLECGSFAPMELGAAL